MVQLLSLAAALDVPPHPLGKFSDSATIDQAVSDGLMSYWP